MSISTDSVPRTSGQPSDSVPSTPGQEEKGSLPASGPSAHQTLPVHSAAGILNLPPDTLQMDAACEGLLSPSGSAGSGAGREPRGPAGGGGAQRAKGQRPACSDSQSVPGLTPHPASSPGPSDPETGGSRHSPPASSSSPSAPNSPDGEGHPRRPDPSDPPPSPPPDLWKTPFWIIEDFQAPCQACRQGDAARREGSVASTGDEPSPPVIQQPPYFDLEVEDLTSYESLHPGAEPRVRDSELMDVPDGDLEFWGQFYFAGVDKARELIRQRRRQQKRE